MAGAWSEEGADATCHGAEPSLAGLGFKTKIRVGKVYLGHAHPGWPMATVNVEAEMNQFEAQLAKLGASLADVEFVDGGILNDAQQLPQVAAKLKGVTGILAVHLTIGNGPLIRSLMDLNLPIMNFTMPMNGHEWHIVAGWQREGRLVDIVSSSRYEDVAEAIRPFRAIQRLREARVLHISQGPADAKYCQAIKGKFGTEIISLTLEDLQKAYQAVTMNCLGMGLIDRNMGYPCLGFVRLNNALLAGVCEADLKSTVTQLPFTERGCRSKLTMRVANIDRFLSNWSCGLHRVIFYGDHTRDLNRFCRLTKIRILREGVDDLQNVPGLEWEPHVHA